MTLANLPMPAYTGADLSARVNATALEARAARRLPSVAALLADTTLAYDTGARPVAAGDIVEAGGFRYAVAAPAATTHHLATAGGVKLNVEPRDGRFPLRAFGVLATATGAGLAASAAQNTPILDTAIRACKNNPLASTVTVVGILPLTFAGLDFTGSTNIIRIEVNGELHPTDTITLTSSWQLAGLGGSQSNPQFAMQHSARIVPAPGVSPVVALRDAGRHAMQNITCTGFGGLGLALDGVTTLGALAELRNVYFSSTADGAVALDLNNWFWAWFEQCVFASTGAGGSPVRLRDTGNASGGGYTGLVYFNDCRFLGQGMTAQCANAAESGILRFRDCVHQNLPAGQVGLTVTGCSTVDCDGLIFADLSPDSLGIFQINSCADFNYRNGRPDYYTNYNVPLFRGGVPANSRVTMDDSSVIDAGNRARQVAAGLNGDNLWFSRGAIGGRMISRSMGSALAPAIGTPIVLPAAPVAPLGTATVTTGQRAPDGSLTAVRVSNKVAGAALALPRFHAAQQTLQNGDIVVFGLMTKATVAAEGSGGTLCARVSYDIGAGGAFRMARTAGASHVAGLCGPDAMISDDGWIASYGYLQVTAGGGTPRDLVYELHVQPSNDFFVAWPWLRILRAADGYTLSDAIRFGQAVGAVPPVQQGVVALQAHQPFRTGRGTTAERPDPAGMNPGAQWFDTTLMRPLFADGATWLVGATQNDLLSSQVTQTGSFSVTNAHLAGRVELVVNSASGVTVTVPSGLTAQEPVAIMQRGAGQVTFAAGAGVTIVSENAFLRTRAQGAWATLIPLGGSEYALTGALAA